MISYRFWFIVSCIGIFIENIGIRIEIMSNNRLINHMQREYEYLSRGGD